MSEMNRSIDLRSDPRAAELAANLAAVRLRVDRACAAAGRPSGEVSVVVVTKFFPAADVRRLAALGVRDLGENRAQEAASKFAEVRSDTPGLRLHFIGQLQTNKAGVVAGIADVVHAVDRPALVRALDRAAAAHDKRLTVLLQVSLEADPGGAARRGGADPADVVGLAEMVDQSGALELGGVMAVAPLGADPDEAFARLAEVAASVRAVQPAATWISAGMSGDLEAAVRHGATHLRVGTAILGSRPTLR